MPTIRESEVSRLQSSTGLTTGYLSDLRKAFYGSTKTQTDGIRAYLQANGGGSSYYLSDLWRTYFLSKGVASKSSLNDMARYFFENVGFSTPNTYSLLFTSGNRVQVKVSAILSTQANVSISAWIKATSLDQPTSGGAIYSERHPSEGNDIFKFAFSDTVSRNKLKFQYRDTAGTLNTNYSTNGISDLNWHHVALVKQGTGITFYVDGSADGTATLTATDTLIQVPLSQIGNDPRDGNSSFLGRIDDVIVYTTNLSAANVSSIRNNTSIPTSQQKGWWKFEEGSGTAVIDSSGVQSNGTITGATYSTDVHA